MENHSLRKKCNDSLNKSHFSSYHFEGVINTVSHIPDPLTPQSKGTGLPRRERDAELIMNVLEKFLGGLDIVFRDIYDSVSLEIEGRGFYGGQKPYVWLCWVIQYSFLLLSLFQD